jgi:hypothetical protein
LPISRLGLFGVAVGAASRRPRLHIEQPTSQKSPDDDEELDELEAVEDLVD